MAEQSAHARRDNAIQKPKKKRSQAEKIGRLKYNQFLLKRVLTEIREVRAIERIILNGLKSAGYFHFGVPMIQKLACADQVDVEIVELVLAVGLQGIFPKDVAANLSQYSLKHYHVSRRILRMNKRLEYETGERLFEKRGWKWALTRFAFDVWGETEKEMKQEPEEEM
jgi:hypothetical protein